MRITIVSLDDPWERAHGGTHSILAGNPARVLRVRGESPVAS